MEVYASSVLLYAYRLEEAFKIARDLGYDGVEVWHYHLRQTGESPAWLGRLARELELSLSVHALSWDLNFTSMLPESREISLRLLEAGIDAAAELEAGPVVVHPGRITAPNDSAGRYWPLLVEGVGRLAHYAAGRGLTVSLELMEHIPREFFIMPEDTGRLLKEVNAPNLSITYDAAHVPWQEEPLAYLKRMSGVGHIHLSDADERQFHLALGQGKRNFTALMRYLRDQLNVPVAIEGRIEYERSTALAAQNKAIFDSLLR